MFSFSQLLLLAFFACAFKVTVGRGVGWTYATTSESCAGTPLDPCGIEYWGQVEGSGACALHSQSPIDFSQEVVVNTSMPAPDFEVIGGGCKEWIQFSTNYTFEAATYENGEFLCENISLAYKDRTYHLIQIHFHSPSEHTIGGGYFSAEAHMVHIHQETEELLVIGVFLLAAPVHLTPSNNTFLDNLWVEGGSDILAGIPTHVHDAEKSFNPYQTLLPGNPGHYVYNGSLTTPPCYENVQWLVYNNPVMISQDDLSILRSAFSVYPHTIVSENGNNNRFRTEPLNGRIITYVPGDGFTCENSLNSPGNNDGSDDGDDNSNLKNNLSIGALVLAILAFIVCILLVASIVQLQTKFKNLELIVNTNSVGGAGVTKSPVGGNDTL